VGDAEELAMRFRGRSLSDAILVLEALRPKITADWERRALDAALDRVRDAGG
jgi:DNA-binding protein